MTYDDFFSRYGQKQTYAEHTIRIYCQAADNINTLSGIEASDKNVVENIKRLESYIETLKEHRIKLAERYGQLSTMAYKHRIEFTRRKKFDNSVCYYLQFWQIYEDGTKADSGSEKYTGKERHKAIKRFAELKKLHPGYEFVEDIAKSPWER